MKTDLLDAENDVFLPVFTDIRKKNISYVYYTFVVPVRRTDRREFKI